MKVIGTTINLIHTISIENVMKNITWMCCGANMVSGMADRTATKIEMEFFKMMFFIFKGQYINVFHADFSDHS